MKNLERKIVLGSLFLSLAFYPMVSNAVEKRVTPIEMTSTEKTAEVKVLTARLEVIEKMDKSNMKASEKKALRKEVRTIKKSLDAMGEYVYVSAIAIILIVILLIVLL